MLKKKETEEHSRECLRSKECRGTNWMSGEPDFTRSQLKMSNYSVACFFILADKEFMTIPRISICLIDGSKSQLWRD